MYLSRITLRSNIGLHSQLGRILTDNSYSVHRLLWDLFPDSKQRGYLFREENAREQLVSDRNLPMYYLLSDVKPATDSPLLDVDSKHFSPSLQTGDRLMFKLRANPVVARRREEKKHASHHDVVMDAQRQWLLEACERLGLSTDGKKRELKQRLIDHPDLALLLGEAKSLEAKLQRRMEEAGKHWLLARSEKNGFVLADNGDGKPQLQSTGYRWHALPEKGRRAGYSSMDYEGELIVTNPETFLTMVKQGVGRSKAFGCGLMMIKRA